MRRDLGSKAKKKLVTYNDEQNLEEMHKPYRPDTNVIVRECNPRGTSDGLNEQS